MVAAMQYEDFYASGTYSVPELGVYAGWTAHEDSLAAGQPFFNEQRDIALIFSGECFIDPQSRCDLKHKGHTLETDNDWLVHLYEESGERFFEELNGLFSGLLIDRRQRKAFLLNDRYGAERIYWHQSNDALYFASEAKALLAVLPELRGFDLNGVAQFLAFGCTLDWQTLFNGIRLLPGGSLWEFGNGTIKKGRYFDSRAWESLPSLSVERFESAFEETFERILPRYTPGEAELGISLTGGLDTRMIIACLPGSHRAITSYTFTGRDRETLDDRIASQVAKVSGLEHHLLRLGADFFSDFACHVDQTVYVTDGSFGVTGAHEIYFNKQARRLAPIRLTGLYGSEILRGASTFKPVGLSPALISPEFGPPIKSSINQFASDQVHPVTSAAFKNVPWNLFGSAAASRSQVTLRTPYLDNEIVRLAFQAPEILRRSPQACLRVVENNSKQLREIPTDRRVEDKDGKLVNRLKRAFFEAGFKFDYLHNEGMPDWLLPFDPILDQIDSKIRIFGHHKYLHYRTWFQGELADYVQDVVAEARTRGAPFWNPDFLETMAGEHIRRRRNHTLEINAVITLEAIERLLLRGGAYTEVKANNLDARAAMPTAVA
jgi:asparagine synthase (glutamine-hydrolysing)